MPKPDDYEYPDLAGHTETATEGDTVNLPDSGLTEQGEFPPGKHLPPWIDERLMQMERRILAAIAGRQAHSGDPCIYCGKPHDVVGVGDCPGKTDERGDT